MLLAILAGALIGVLLGALGGGGSILAVPVLVYGFGESAHAAATGSLVVVGTTALIAALARTRTGGVDWRRGLVFGALGIVGAYAGAQASARIEPEVLLLAFGALLLVVAVLMWRRAAEQASSGPQEFSGEARAGGPARPIRVFVTATTVGLLTGFFGVGGGFAVIPALVLALEMPMALAVGTSLVVIAINCASALLARAGTDIAVDWSVVLPLTLAAVLASMLAGRVAQRIAQHRLTRAFAILLILVGAYMTVRTGLSLR